MKTTVIPAQVTTVEDRIAGSLGVSQLALLATPIFLGSLIYGGVPPALHNAWYKLMLIVMITVACIILAVRVRDRIILYWLVILLRYKFRPRYYVFNKRSLCGRGESATIALPTGDPNKKQASQPAAMPRLSTRDLVALQAFMENPLTNLRFETTKGGVYVRVTEKR